MNKEAFNRSSMKTAVKLLLIVLAVSLTTGDAIAEKKKKKTEPEKPTAVETVSTDPPTETDEVVDETVEEEVGLKRIPVDMKFTEDGVVEDGEPSAAIGLNIFLKKCSACHSVVASPKKTKKNRGKIKKEVAPTLLNVTARHTEEWLIRWLTDPQITWEDEENEETNELKRRVLERGISRAETKMKLRVKEKDLPHILAYLNTVTDKPNEPEKEPEKEKSKKSKKKKK